MKTDDLIEALARGVEPAERLRWRRNLAITLAAGLLVSILLVAIGLGVRPDIGAARMPIMMKAAFSALCAAVVLPAVVRLMRPGRPLGWRIGAVLLFSAGLGLVRMPDAFSRIQAGTKASTLGNMLVLAGLAVYHPGWCLKLLLIVYFVLMTNPISSHALARAAVAIGIPMTSGTVVHASPEAKPTDRSGA